MADSIGLRVDTTSLKRQFAQIDKAADRATMWGLRQVGRAVKTGARRKAPVYRGKPRNRKGVPMKPGELKRSISSSKRLTRYGGAGYGLTVAPRGTPRLYAGKQEARYGYMAAGVALGRASAPATFAASYEKAIRRASI